MHGSHDVFLPELEEDNDPNSVKKLRKQDGAWALDKEILGFDFDSRWNTQTLILGEAKRDALADTVKQWLQLVKNCCWGSRNIY